MTLYEQKRILVTGGTGSIGSEIVRQLLPHRPKEIRIFSRGEITLSELQRELRDSRQVTFRIGDIRDRVRLAEAMEDIDMVFHVAAMKHVDICEYNPSEAIKTNVIGTQHIIKQSLLNNVERVIIISTDKATNPTNTMGATKLLAERLMAEADATRPAGKWTVFCAVRFGNVLGSSGSVIPLFKKMIEEEKRVRITNEEMTRFVMTIPEAARLVLEAGQIAQGGETFVLKMRSLKLGDLAEVMIESCRPAGMPAPAIAKEVIGLRPGEKIHEDLITETEWSRTLETPQLYIIRSPVNPKPADYHNLDVREPQLRNYNSKNSRLLTRDEIRQLLEKEALI